MVSWASSISWRGTNARYNADVRTHRNVATVLAECVFLLESFYEHPRGHIVAALGRLIASPGVEISGVEIHLDALHRYQRTKVHFVDCLIAATSTSEEIPVARIDEDFRKVADARVENEQFP